MIVLACSAQFLAICEYHYLFSLQNINNKVHPVLQSFSALAFLFRGLTIASLLSSAAQYTKVVIERTGLVGGWICFSFFEQKRVEGRTNILEVESYNK
jgi:hypothetical protein